VYGEACGSAPRAQRISVRLLLVKVHEGVDIFDPIDTTGGKYWHTIRNNRGMLERMKESFHRRLHYCIDNNGGHFEHFL
jgi:hypothetical protein